MGLNVTYKGQQIAQLTEGGNLTLETAGKYCEGDIELAYSGGGGDTLEIKGFISIALAYESNMPTKWRLSSGYIETIALAQTSGMPHDNFVYIEDVEVIGNSLAGGMNIRGDFRANAVYALKKINLNFIPLSNIYTFSFTYGADKNPDFKSLLGLNFSKVGGGNYRIGNLGNLGALENVTVKPNTLGQMDLIDQTKNWLSFTTSQLLTDASLVQIANGLCATYTSKLVLSSTPKARCSTLFGTLSQVTDDTGTYDFFTQDSEGTISLADFITITKGWTLA